MVGADTINICPFIRFREYGDVYKRQVMANTASVTPQNLSAYYQREYMEWGEPLDTITKSTHVTLSAAQYDDPSEKYAVKIVSSSNPNEIFVVEFRNLSGNDQVLSSYCTCLLYTSFMGT